MLDEEIKAILININTKYLVLMLGVDYGIYTACKIVKYVNRTGDKKDLFIDAIDLDGEKILSLIIRDLACRVSMYHTEYRDNIRGILISLIWQHVDHLFYMVIKYKLSDEQLEFMINAINLKYSYTELERKVITDGSFTKFITQYRTRFHNDPEKIANLKTSLYLTDVIYNNIEEYYNHFSGKSKYDLFLQIKQYEIVYEKLATFVETLDNYRKDTKNNDNSDIIISSKALNSVLNVVQQFSST